MERVEYLPIGSLVVVKGNVRKIVIIARGLITKIGEEHRIFDYGGCIYPEGLVGDKVLYFNHNDILKVVHEGYKDDDEVMMVDNINEMAAKLDIPKGEPYELNKQNLKL